MDVGIIGGTGPAGMGLGARLADCGLGVAIGSRDPSRAESVVEALLGRWPGRKLQLSGVGNEAAARADVVVVATPWDAAAPTAAALGAALDSKVVISMANAMLRQGKEMQPLFLGRGSVAQAVAAAAPAALVAAAFHHLPAKGLAQLDEPIEADVLVCADDPVAAATTAGLVRAVPGLRPLEAGSLANAAALESFTALLVTVNIRHRAHSVPRLGGVRDGEA